MNSLSNVLAISIQPTAEVITHCSLAVTIQQFFRYLSIILIIHFDNLEP